MNGKQSHYERVFKAVCEKYGERSVYAMAAKMHDHVEDGLVTDDNLEQSIADEWGLKKSNRKVKRAAKAIRILTRDKNYTYRHYIKTLCHDRVARKVKLEDLKDNALRKDSPPPGELLKRYEWAIDYIDKYEYVPINATVWGSVLLLGMGVCWFMVRFLCSLQ